MVEGLVAAVRASAEESDGKNAGEPRANEATHDWKLLIWATDFIPAITTAASCAFCPTRASIVLNTNDVIPPDVRTALAADPFMLRCFRWREGACSGRVEWEHAFIYAGNQIQERWAIIPCCTFHHRGAGLDKNLNRYAALLRMTAEELAAALTAYPRTDWRQQHEWLRGEYPDFAI